MSGNYHKLQNELGKFEKLQKEVSALASVKLDKKGLESELKDQEKRVQQDIKKLEQELRRKEEVIKTMETQIEELMKFKALSEIKKRPAHGSAPVARAVPRETGSCIR